ncbi:MAG: DinB family protein [Nocardioidaceae bacterium]
MPNATPPATRIDPPTTADERTMLETWLDFHRETLLWKAAGLSDVQLKTAAVPPSTLTLLGLVRHMAEVERGWFAAVCGQDETDIYCSEQDPDGDWNNLADADVKADFATLRREIALYREHAPQHSLEETHAGRTREYSLRWIYVHMIEEYARHNGHADLLRESLDGVTGD